MKTQLSLILGLILIANSKVAFTHGVTKAKASELSLHRVERLVALCNLGDPNQPLNIPGQPGYDPAKCKNVPNKPKKGIDPDYQNKISNLNIELLPHENEEDPSFKATVYQHRSKDSSQKAVEIVLDEEGRPISYQEINGGVPHAAPVWPDKDPTTLSENALHYIFEGSVTKPELAPYNENLTSFTIVSGTSADEQQVAVVDFLAEGETKILRVRLKLNGEYDSAEFVSP